jgi:septum formation protein
MEADRLILASRSPQRRAILEQVGVAFDVVAPDVEELANGEPSRLVVENALRKARAVAGAAAAEATVLGCDTAVALDGEVFGKPRDAEEAERFLRGLSGRAHAVHSGLALIEAGEERTAGARTEVRFRQLDGPTLRWYLDSGEWRERAGGYAIQGRGAALVAGIDGDYLNVVGLPLATLLELKPSLPLLHR